MGILYIQSTPSISKSEGPVLSIPLYRIDNTGPLDFNIEGVDCIYIMPMIPPIYEIF